MFFTRPQVKALVVFIRPAAWAWREQVEEACAFWNKACRFKAFRISDIEPHDIRIARIHITEDFCSLRFFRDGERVVDVDTYLPPETKKRMLARALGLSAGLAMDDDARSVMCSSVGPGRYRVSRLQRRVLRGLLG